MISGSIIIIIFGIAVYFVGGLIFTDTSKLVLGLVAVSLSVILGGILVYKVYKGVHTLPEGAHYIEDSSEKNEEEKGID